MSSSSREMDLFTPTEEHGALRNMLQGFVKTKVDPQALEHDREEKFNIKLFRELGELGLLGLTAPEKYGGSEMDALAAVIAHEELSSSDPAFCLSFLAHSMLFVNNIARNASDAQCLQYLPDACSGKKICGMAMSEPSVGTDVLGMRTTAKKSDCGKFYVLNGTKMWITNGALNDTELGDTFLVYARTDTTGKAKHDFSSFIVEKGYEGFSLGQRIKDKCGMRASSTAELVFENCIVPIENLIGTEGSAVLCMMRNLEIERVTLAAMSLGIARRSLEVMSSYAKEREAFGRPLNNFGQIQKNIAESYAEYMAGRAYVYNTARQLKLDSVGNRVDTDGVKLYCGDMAKRVADRAIQTLGGYGYVGEYNVERLWRDSKLLEIGGGTNESHHKNMVQDLPVFFLRFPRNELQSFSKASKRWQAGVQIQVPALFFGVTITLDCTVQIWKFEVISQERAKPVDPGFNQTNPDTQLALPELKRIATIGNLTLGDYRDEVVHLDKAAKGDRKTEFQTARIEVVSPSDSAPPWTSGTPRGHGNCETQRDLASVQVCVMMVEQPTQDPVPAVSCNGAMATMKQEPISTARPVLAKEMNNNASVTTPAVTVKKENETGKNKVKSVPDLPREVLQFAPLLIGKYYIQDKRALWSGMWGMNESAFGPKGIISTFEMKSQEDVMIPVCTGTSDVVHPAMLASALARSSQMTNAAVSKVSPIYLGYETDVIMRSAMPFQGKYSGSFQIQAMKGKHQIVTENDVDIRFVHDASNPAQFIVSGSGENRFGMFTLHGFLDKETSELRLYKVYKPKDPVKRTFPRRARSTRAVTPAVKREAKALSISAPGAAAITASVDVAKIVTPIAGPTIVAPRKVGTPMSDYSSPPLVLGRSERKRSMPAHLREDNVLEFDHAPMSMKKCFTVLKGLMSNPNQVHIYANKLMDDFEKRFKSLHFKLSIRSKHADVKLKKDRKTDVVQSSKKVRGGKGTKGNTKRRVPGEDTGLIMSLKEDIERLKATLEQLQPSMAKAGSLKPVKSAAKPFRMEDMTEEELNEPMSQMDKARLSSDIKLLPQDKINRVLQIIAEAVPVAKLANENDEVELDINAFDTRCLRMLEGYVRENGIGRKRKRPAKKTKMAPAEKRLKSAEVAALNIRHRQEELKNQLAAIDRAGTSAAHTASRENGDRQTDRDSAMIDGGTGIEAGAIKKGGDSSSGSSSSSSESSDSDTDSDSESDSDDGDAPLERFPPLASAPNLSQLDPSALVHAVDVAKKIRDEHLSSSEPLRVENRGAWSMLAKKETPNGTPLIHSNGGSESSSLWLSARSMEQIKQQKLQQKEKKRTDELEALKRREAEQREKEKEWERKKEREQAERRKLEQQAAKLADEKRIREERARDAERVRLAQLAMEREKLARDDDVELHDATLSEDLDAFSSSSFL
ncbi:unnamed protein product [Peronospora belbahrii]|uniref:NET domain-containing protein n=1 Tax=Peronospora belbahrii TaxID=622444 RepID=A0AAU9L5X1_9STRA|nr:unnamed protein product [Peronospora belbahrii]